MAASQAGSGGDRPFPSISGGARGDGVKEVANNGVDGVAQKPNDKWIPATNDDGK